MDDKDLQSLYEGMMEAVGGALGLLTSVLVKQLDPERLAAELRVQLDLAQSTGLFVPAAIKLATHALAAADAECLARKQERIQPKH